MSNPKPTTLVELLKAGLAARLKGVSMREVARQAGIAQPILSRFLNGGRAISLRNAEALAAYFGIRHVVPPKRGPRRAAGE